MRQFRSADRKAIDAAGAGAAATVGKSTLVEGLGHGEGLPAEHRGRFEKSLGRDLSQVRLHTDDRGARLAELFGSRAFAAGSDIAFAKGEYQPHRPDGAHLLAHEVAHTAQQAGAAPAEALATTQPGDAVEAGADTAAAAMLAGRSADVIAAPMAIARRTQDEPRAPSDAAAGEAGAAGAAGDKTGGKPGDKNDEQIGDLSADRIGEEVDEVPVNFPVRTPESSRHEIAGAGAHVPHDAGPGTVSASPEVGGRIESGGGAAPEAGGGVHAEHGPAVDAGAAGADGGAPDGGADAGAAGDGGGGGGSAGAALSATALQAQHDARDAAAAAEAEAAAYKAQVGAQRDKFDAGQRDLALAQLKTMSATEKRSTLTELGYDPKKVAQLKDSELDSLISGKLEAEAQKAKILGMTPEELAALSPAQKTKFLTDLGVDRGDLDKAGPAKTAQLFNDVTKAAHIPGTHKVKVQIKGGLFGKSWVVTVKCDTDGGVDLQAKKEGGIFAKLAGWIKAALPLVLTVLAPITGGAALIALSVYQAVNAIKSGNWLTAVIGVAGAVAGLGALSAIKNGVGGLAGALGKVAAAADKIKNAGIAAQQAMAAAKAKNAGGLLAALANGAAAFAGAAGAGAGKFAQTMKQWEARLRKWSTIATGGQKVIDSIKHGDLIGALGNALSTAGTAIAKGKTAQDLQRAAKLTNLVNDGRKALTSHPPNYTAVADAAFGIASQLSNDRRIEDAHRIATTASKLKTAWAARDKNPAGVVEAALALAQSIELAKYDLDHKDTKTADGKPDAKRAQITARYERATRTVKTAGSVITAMTAKPHPNYLAALDGIAQLAADLTDDKRIDAAAVVTSRGEALRKAIASGNAQQIAAAGQALAEAINGLRKEIEAAHHDAKQDAQAQLPAGEHLPDDGAASLPPLPSPANSVAPDGERIHGPNAGPEGDDGSSWTASGTQTNGTKPGLDDAGSPGPKPSPSPSPKPEPPHPLHFTGVIAAGGPISNTNVDVINTLASEATPTHKHYIAYADVIKIGGALSWRANNPGNLAHSPAPPAATPATPSPCSPPRPMASPPSASSTSTATAR
jgi:hypothetical protein